MTAPTPGRMSWPYFWNNVSTQGDQIFPLERRKRAR